LYSGKDYGQPVHAATFIRKRRIILDQELERRPRELDRIVVHELFHFVWVRMSNGARRSYETLVRREWKDHARGELGWSAESRKLALRRNARSMNRRNRWREYVCESFCDTAASLFSGVRRHPEFTLSARCRKRRASWFRDMFRAGEIPI